MNPERTPHQTDLVSSLHFHAQPLYPVCSDVFNFDLRAHRSMYVLPVKVRHFISLETMGGMSMSHFFVEIRAILFAPLCHM